MSILLSCECGFSKEVPDDWAGKKVKCKCGLRLTVPDPTPANQPEIGSTKPVAEQPTKKKRVSKKPSQSPASGPSNADTPSEQIPSKAEKSQPVEKTPASIDKSTAKRDVSNPPDDLDDLDMFEGEPVANEVTRKARPETPQTSKKDSKLATGADIVRDQSATKIVHRDAPPPPAHAPQMKHANAAEVKIDLGTRETSIDEKVTPELNLPGSSQELSLGMRQKAQQKSDQMRLIIYVVVGFVCLLVFGGLFLMGTMLNRFNQPIESQENAQPQGQVETMEVPETKATIVAKPNEESEENAKTPGTQETELPADPE